MSRSYQVNKKQRRLAVKISAVEQNHANIAIAEKILAPLWNQYRSHEKFYPSMNMPERLKQTRQHMNRLAFNFGTPRV